MLNHFTYDCTTMLVWRRGAGLGRRSLLVLNSQLSSDMLQVYISMVMFKVCGVAVFQRACPRMLQNILGRFHLARSAFLARHGKV